jgi:hypothetical protein
MPLRLTLLTLLAAGNVHLAAQDLTVFEVPAVGGYVRFASGNGIGNVRVSLILPGDPSPLTTRTGADGSFRFDAVPAGEYQLSASHAGAVFKRVRVVPGAATRDLDFSIPDGDRRRVVTGRIVMNDASTAQRVSARIAGGIIRPDGTLVLPLAPGDHRVTVRLAPGYFVDSATHGSATVYSIESVGGRRLSSAAFALTVPPEPEAIPELVITLGAFVPN